MILIFGDSIAWGAWDEKGGWAQRIKNFADKKAAESNFDNYTSVYPLGVSGNNTKKLLKRLDVEVEARKWENEKMQIIIAMGVNDSYFFNSDNRNSIPLIDYEANILELIQKSTLHEAELIFLGLTPVDERVNPAPWRPEISWNMELIQQYNKKLEEICKLKDIPFIEILSKFAKSDPKDLLQDGLHPNTKGHELIYNEVLTYLKKNSYI